MHENHDSWDDESAKRRYRARGVEQLSHMASRESNAHLLDAKANLMKEQRLSAKAEHLNAIGHAAAKLENGARTQDALGKLGAGKEYGAS
jgi:hypothetical protein